jgi:hypothetical protein
MAIFSETSTLVADTVTTVTLSGGGDRFRVTSLASSGPLFFRVDGVDPVLGADEALVCLPMASRVVGAPASGQIRLRHAGTPDVTVELEG